MTMTMTMTMTMRMTMTIDILKSVRRVLSVEPLRMMTSSCFVMIVTEVSTCTALYHR